MKDYDAKITGDRIRKYRLAKNFSISELSEKVNITPSYLSALERAAISENGSVRLNVICKISQVLGVTLDDLAGDNLECRETKINALDPRINRIIQEMDSIAYNRLILFRNILNSFIK